MSTGKRFEEDFQNSVNKNKDYIYRLRDCPASFGKSKHTKFSTSNICDFLMNNRYSKDMLLLELKTTKGKSLSFQNLKEKQRKEMCEIKAEGVKAFYIINFSELGETYAIEVKEVQNFINTATRKSIPIQFLRDNAIRVGQFKKITRYTYNIDRLLRDL